MYSYLERALKVSWCCENIQPVSVSLYMYMIKDARRMGFSFPLVNTVQTVCSDSVFRLHAQVLKVLL